MRGRMLKCQNVKSDPTSSPESINHECPLIPPTASKGPLSLEGEGQGEGGQKQLLNKPTRDPKG